MSKDSTSQAAAQLLKELLGHFVELRERLRESALGAFLGMNVNIVARVNDYARQLNMGEPIRFIRQEYDSGSTFESTPDNPFFATEETPQVNLIVIDDPATGQPSFAISDYAQMRLIDNGAKVTFKYADDRVTKRVGELLDRWIRHLHRRLDETPIPVMATSSEAPAAPTVNGDPLDTLKQSDRQWYNLYAHTIATYSTNGLTDDDTRTVYDFLTDRNETLPAYVTFRTAVSRGRKALGQQKNSPRRGRKGRNVVPMDDI